MRYTQAKHPLWQHSLDMAFEFRLISHPGNPISRAMNHAFDAYLDTLWLALRSRPGLLRQAARLLSRLEQEMVRAADLLLLDREWLNGQAHNIAQVRRYLPGARRAA